MPMHWPVLLAGLAYGGLGGGMVGALAPAISALVSGAPPPGIVPLMSIELALYGAVSGLLFYRVRCPGWLAILVALVVGRSAFYVGMVAATGSMGPSGPQTLPAVHLGWWAAAAQVVILPSIARAWNGVFAPTSR
jgi:niacin transporter